MDRRNKKSKLTASYSNYPHQPILPLPYPHVPTGLHHYHHRSFHHLHHPPSSPVSMVAGAASALQHDTFGATTMIPSSTDSWLSHHHSLHRHNHHHHQLHHHTHPPHPPHHLHHPHNPSQPQPDPVTNCSNNSTSSDGTNSEMEVDTGYKSNTTIDDLLPEILSIIFSHLDLRSKGRAAQVCSTWQDACYDKSVWKGVEAKLHLKKINSTMIDSLNRRGIKRVQILSFQKGLKELTTIKNLERLTLTGCYNLTDEHLAEALSQEMPSLRQLSLGMCKQITSIFVSLCHILQNTPNIQVLDLGGCSEITDSALITIRKCLRRLKQLNLRSCRYITDFGISRLCLDSSTDDIDEWKLRSSNTNTFRYLNLNDTKDRNNNKSHRKGGDENGDDEDDGLTSLELLDLQDCQTLTDDSLKFISCGLRNLQSLNLSFCIGITDMGLKYLSSMTSLKEINLRSCSNITDNGLRYLSESGIQLKILDVSFCDKIGDTGLIYISLGLTSLVTLSLNSCSISDQGLIKVSTSLTNLKTLNIGQCNKITDVGVASLAENCLKLENIDLYGCTRITQAGQEKILRLPLLKYLNTGLWQDLETPVYFHPFSPNSLVRDHHSPGCVLRQSNRNFATSSYHSNQLINQYKNIYAANCGEMFLPNCILTKLCDSCQNVSFLLNPTIHASPLYVVLRLDKS